MPAAGTSSARSADAVGANRAVPHGLCPHVGCATMRVCVQRTPSSTTRRVCAASRACTITVRTRTRVPRARMTRAVVGHIVDSPVGLVSVHLQRPYPVYCATGRCVDVNVPWKQRTQDTRVLAAGVDHTRPPLRKDCWTRVLNSDPALTTPVICNSSAGVRRCECARA